MTLWVVVLATIGGAACSGGDATGIEPPADNVVLRVVVDDEVAADWTLADLEEQVAFAELAIDGDLQSGPLLVDVLRASGVVEWKTGEVYGMGEGRVFEISLPITAAEVDAGWVLDVTNQGTLKLASVDIPRDRWVRDVGEIRIP
jgi:hypothetical protein